MNVKTFLVILGMFIGSGCATIQPLNIDGKREGHAPLIKMYEQGLWELRESVNDQEAMVRARLAQALWEDQYLDRAWNHWHWLKKVRPEWPGVQLGYGILAFYQGPPFDRALRAFAKAHALAPDDPKPLIWLAKVEEERGHWDRALAIYKRILNQNPHVLEARVGQIRTLEWREDWQEAIPILEALIRDWGESPQWIYQLAQAYEHIHRFREAERWYQLWAMRQSNGILGWKVLEQFYRRQQCKDKAEKAQQAWRDKAQQQYPFAKRRPLLPSNH